MVISNFAKMDAQQPEQKSSESADPLSQVDANHHIEHDCEQLLRKTKKQVKRLMEEAVTRKFIHIESGGLNSLCVAVDMCLMHGLKRRVLGLFKTSSSMALVHKMAKTYPAAKQILQSVENYKLDLMAAEQKRQAAINATDNEQNKQKNNNNDNDSRTKHKQQQVQQTNSSIPSRRFIWIKFALMEAKLVDIIEYLGKNAGKFYEANALMSDYLCAQILCSLLVGPSALEFSRHKVNEFAFQEDPSAYDLVKRHKLANPIACACKQEQQSMMSSIANDCDINNNNNNENDDDKQIYRDRKMSGNIATTSNNTTSTAFETSVSNNNIDSQTPQTNWLRSSSIKAKTSGLNRRRPLSIKTNVNRPLLMTECHHYSCQEITEHKQMRGYSMLITSQGPLSAPSPIAQRATFQQSATSKNNFNDNTQQQNNKIANKNGSDTPKQQQAVNNYVSQQKPDNSWSLWSPRMLHEIMHQNSRSRLIYAKNNILIENQANNFVPGYLSLHETSDDLILKWIPNQMINGSQCANTEQEGNQCNQVVNEIVGDKNNTKLNDIPKELQQENESIHTTIEDAKNNQWNSIKDPTPIESSYLDLVVSISISSIVLLHCHFRSSSIECIINPMEDNDEVDVNNVITKHEEIIGESSHSIDQEISSEETLILVEADGIQRAPFRFPKGGLRLFLSCLDAALAPNRFLDPAISLDQSSQWPQHPLTSSNYVNSRSSQQVTQSGRSTPLGHSSSLCGDSTETTETVATAASTTLADHINSSSLGKFDSLLKRFPSLRRVRRQRHSSSNDDHTTATPTTPTTLKKANISNDNDSVKSQILDEKQGHSIAPTNNYIYRIVSLQQPDWSLPTPPDSSSTGISSPSYINLNNTNIQATNSNINSNNNNNNRNLIRDFGNFRWNLRRWTNFARPETHNSSSSTMSSSFGQLQADDCNDKLEQQTTVESSCNLSSSSSQESSLMNAIQQQQQQQQQQRINPGDESGGAAANAMIDHNSLKLMASIEAKLNDLKKSTSEEILESFRTNSIETLCKSMRKQIIARAFYGWLVHCRRSKLIRKHLSHLLKPLSQQQHDTFADILDEHCAIDEGYSGGLTQSIWQKLMEQRKQRGENEDDYDESSVQFIAQKVSLYVYFGGIKGIKLRKQVWPYLLKYYLYTDNSKVSQRKHDEARKAYKDCAAEWIVIEREVLRRDNEILAANIARAKRESNSKQLNAKNKENCTNTHCDDVESKIDLKPASCDTSNCNDDNNDQSNVNMNEMNSNHQAEQISCKPIESCCVGGQSLGAVNCNSAETNKPITSETIIESKGESSTEILNKPENYNNNGIDKQNDANNSVVCTQNNSEKNVDIDSRCNDKISNDNLVNNCASKQQQQQPKRWRLESTGSVGSDAPITDQFGNNIHRIDKDVQRCDRNFWYFKDKKNLAKLRNIMCTYVWQNLKIGYVQGMCDLAAPFLVILDDEFEAFQCYNELMKRMVDNFPLGSAMDKHFEALRYLLQVMDPKLFQVLQCDNEDNSCFYFCYRWLLLDFKRELPYGDVYLVWETIWAARDVATDHFVVFLAFAMVRYYRDIIIENNMDYTDTLKFFNEMAERHDIRRILKLARESISELYSMIMD